MPAPKSAKSDESPSFENALARLESLVKEMEGGTLSLDRMMACFEEGSQLVKVCETKLNEVEKKIEILVKKGDAHATQPFQPEKEDAPF
jgi:exodeoxyribonuclease VII small subunit